MSHVLGFICELKSLSVGNNREGIITIADIDKSKTKIRVNHDDYIKAIEAHLKGLPVRITITDQEAKPPVGSNLEVWAVNVGSYLPDDHLDKLSNDLPALVYESHEKGYGIRSLLYGQTIQECFYSAHTNLILVSFYKRRNCKKPSLYMFREIPDPNEILTLGVRVEQLYLQSSSCKDLIQRCKEVINPQIVSEES